MKINKYKLKLENEQIINKFLGYSIINIQTTGLSKHKDAIISYASLEIKKDSELQIYSIESLDEELYLLKAIDLNNQKVISYNGDNFALAFIAEKKKAYKLDMGTFKSFDLYKYVRKNKNFLKLENYKQSSIENFLNIEKNTDIVAKDIEKLYKDYLINQKQEFLEKIINYNKENTISLFKCLEITNYLDRKKTLEIFDYKFYIEDIKFYKDTLLVSGKSSLKKPCEFNKLNYSLICKDRNFKIEIIYQENYYDKDNKCKYVFSDDYQNIEMIDKIKAPDNIYILYYKKFFENNILKLAAKILETNLKLIR